MPENFKDYELNIASDAPPWGPRENTLLRDILTLLPNKGKTLLNAEHKHDNLWSNDGAIEAVITDANGNVGINVLPANLGSRLHVVEDGATNVIIFDTFSVASTSESNVFFRKGASDTSGAFNETADGECLGTIGFFGSTTANAVATNSGGIAAVQEGVAGAAHVGMRLEFKTSDNTAAADTKMVLDKDGVLILGNAANTTPKFHLSDGTNIAVIELDANNDLIISSDSGPQPGGIVWDTSDQTCTLTANDGVAVQNLYPLLINWSSANGAPTNNASAIGINNDAGDDQKVGVAFATNNTQRFTLQAEIDNSAADQDFVLYKGTGTAAADVVFKYDNDGHSSGEGSFTFGNTTSRLCSLIVLTSNADDEEDSLLFRFQANDALKTLIGAIEFKNLNIVYAKLDGFLNDATGSSEDGSFRINVMKAGTLLETHTIDGDGFKCAQNATIHTIAQAGAPTSTTEGALWLDTDASANGTLKCFANGSFRTVKAL